ncbi:MAG: CDGSH iron-sulfur domain-containing protein [Planctomycetes bacterium]|nr:CDGSH iron-sulfur domain-containing protein [Planctomycetota bacterium]
MNPTQITVFDNGPIKITGGNFQVLDASGKAWDLAGRDSIALCRCGASANKPFCDGGHRGAGFQSKCEAAVLPPPKPKLA